jgi:hypothetical protein
MSRPKIPLQSETIVLINCRRRCCICFGLERDNRIKQGQIAHLDKNPANNKIQNLAFLCLSHHDSFDSKTSQSKGLTSNEVSHFKNELEQYIIENWRKPILGNDKITIDIFTGIYYRGSEFESSELEITYLGGNLIQVKGLALWGKNKEYGPNIGQLDFVAELNLNKAIFADKLYEKEYCLELEFLGDTLKAKETMVVGYFGMNSSFGGMYSKQK